MGQYLPFVAIAVLAFLFCFLSAVASRILAPRRPSVAKELPYESGIVPTQEPPARFPVRFYLVAMIFIVFDIELIFVYPYAVSYRELGVFGFAEMVLFSLAVFVPFVFLIANGALDWGPAKLLRRGDQATSRERTSTTTVRRVGLEGRDETSGEAA